MKEVPQSGLFAYGLPITIIKDGKVVEKKTNPEIEETKESIWEAELNSENLKSMNHPESTS